MAIRVASGSEGYLKVFLGSANGMEKCRIVVRLLQLKLLGRFIYYHYWPYHYFKQFFFLILIPKMIKFPVSIPTSCVKG